MADLRQLSRRTATGLANVLWRAPLSLSPMAEIARLGIHERRTGELRAQSAPRALSDHGHKNSVAVISHIIKRPGKRTEACANSQVRGCRLASNQLSLDSFHSLPGPPLAIAWAGGTTPSSKLPSLTGRVEGLENCNTLTEERQVMQHQPATLDPCLFLAAEPVRVKQALRIARRHQPMLNHQLLNRLAGFQRFFGNHGGIQIADLGVQGGHKC